MTSESRWGRILAMTMLAITSPGIARADEAGEKRACAADHEQAQRLRRKGELRASRATLVRCSQEACPKWIASECALWLSEVERSVPSVVLHARDGAGMELTDVAVIMDGVPFADQLDGRAVDVDPGSHEFLFRSAGRPSVRVTVVVHEGARSVPVNADFSAPPPPSTGGGDSRAPSSRVGAWVPITLGAVGVAALGSFTFFAVSGYGDQRNDLAACSPVCSQDEIDSVRTKYIVADVSLVVSIVALGAAGYFALTR